MNIYLHLQRDHARQRKLANAILETRPDGKKRFRLFRKFKKAVHEHAELEARTLYTTLLKLPRAHPVARKGIEVQRFIAEGLLELERYPIHSDRWMSRFIQLRDELESLQCVEEEMLYPAARHYLIEPELLDEMSREFDRCKRNRHLPATLVTRLCSGTPWQPTGVEPAVRQAPHPAH